MSKSKRLEKLENEMRSGNGEFSKTVIGFVCPVTKELTSSYHLSSGRWEPTVKNPTAFFAEKLKPLFLNPKRFNAIIGGRGSGKSLGKGGHGAIMMHDTGRNLMCIREFQASVSDSVHALLSSEVKRLELSNFDITDKTIRCAHNGSMARFMGLARNSSSVKSAFGFLDWWIEEAQFLSESSLRDLTPTARKKPVKGLPGKTQEIETDEIDMNEVSMTFCGNPASSEDPFSKRFITPYKDELDKHGIYEDDMHLIIMMNYDDNPWFSDSGLEQERLYDLKHLPRSTYDWIWRGGFNDDIENGLIKPEWFDACIDAHEKLGMKKFGRTIVTHDPSDLGADAKAVAIRVGNIVTDVFSRSDIDVNEGCDWALGVALNEKADEFEWDVGGLGAPLKRDINNALDATRTVAYQFNGASGVDFPDAIYEPSGSLSVKGELTNKMMCKNLRGQCYLSLRDRVYLTYRAVVHNEMCDPDKLISFSSECQELSGLRSEACRMPIKPNSAGLFELYTKKEMREKFKVRSPNLVDCIMMQERKRVTKRKRVVSAPASIASNW